VTANLVGASLHDGPRIHPDVRRRGAVYGIPTFAVDAAGRPLAGLVVVGYVGQTRQTVKQREEQHRGHQPFGDLIVGGSWVIEEGHWTDAELDARELHYIRRGAVLVPDQPPQRPVYNIVGNMDNPNRVKPWDAVAHRQVRQPGWTPEAKVPRQRIPVDYGAASGSRSALSRWWIRRRWPVVGFVALWLALCAGCCWLAAPVLDTDSTALAGIGGASAPFVLVRLEIWRRRVRAWWRRTTRPKRRRRRR
jgi:hypothetical protein